MAQRQMNKEKVGHTLQPTALVHEAFLRLVGEQVSWDSRAHFFAAAAEAMRRILVDRARQKAAFKRGGDRHKVELDGGSAFDDIDCDEVLAVDEALQNLEAIDKRKSEVVKLRYFSGFTIEETAAALNIAPATVKRDWGYARAWLHEALNEHAD